MFWTRRRFLGATVLGLGSPFPGVLLKAAQEAAKEDGNGNGDGDILVVVQLSGGNDGLNTVVPFEDPVYHRSRPSLAVREGAAIRLDHDAGGRRIGLNPELAPLRELYEEGALTVVQGVGYPNPSRSHFRAMDIWHSARPDLEDPADGWLGRVVAKDDPQGRSREALHLGDEELPLALRGAREVPTLQNLDWLDALTTARGKETRGRLVALNRVPRHPEHTSAPLERLRALAASTLESLEGLLALRSRPVAVEYPDNPLAAKLRWTGQLIGGRFPARIFYTTLAGFDTHARQSEMHAHLLRDLGSALRAFYRHLQDGDDHHRVTVLVFSEFGRRLRENGSLGTDHGAAAPVLVLSAAAHGGVLGKHPSLEDLDDGDVRFHTDFRRVYAALLEHTLGLESEAILGRAFEPLPLFA